MENKTKYHNLFISRSGRTLSRNVQWWELRLEEGNQWADRFLRWLWGNKL